MAKAGSKNLVYNPDEDELKAETLPYDPSGKNSYDTYSGMGGFLGKIFSNPAVIDKINEIEGNDAIATPTVPTTKAPDNTVPVPLVTQPNFNAEPTENNATGGFSGALRKVFGDIKDITNNIFSNPAVIDKMYEIDPSLVPKENNDETAIETGPTAPERYQPKEFVSSFDTQIQSVLDKILNGEKFDYDINTDAAYQQYRDMYERNAKKSFDNTFAALTDNSGGYANSYAGAVAQQGYNQTMQDVAAAMPTFEDRAYGRYRDNIGDLYNLYGALVGERANERANYEYDTNLGYDMYLNDRNFDYQLGRDKIEDDWRDRIYADERSDIGYDRSMSEALAAAQYGDYSLIGSLLGIDTSNAVEMDKLNKAVTLYETTGSTKLLEELGYPIEGIDPKKLAVAISTYEATGNGQLLRDLGIDTSFMDKYNNATLNKLINGYSGSVGGGSSSGSSGGRSSGGSSGKSSGSSGSKSSSSGSSSGSNNASGSALDKAVAYVVNNLNGAKLDTRTADDVIRAAMASAGISNTIANTAAVRNTAATYLAANGYNPFLGGKIG